MHQVIDIGEPVTMHALFISETGAAVDPATIVLLITKPDGTTITKNKADLATTGVGHYSYTTTADVAGVWTYKFTPSAGAIQEEFFLVGTAIDTQGPCDSWIGPEDVFALAPASAIAEAARDYGLAASIAEGVSAILYKLSEHRYPGICADVIRPCRRGRWSFPGWWAWREGWGACGCGAEIGPACSCHPSTMLLGGSPILGIRHVKINGTTLTASQYRVDDYRWLTRLDDEPWPAWQDLAAATTEPDTFEVSYFYGVPAPADGVLAAQRLAGELYQASNGGICKLPQRIRSMARQGIEVGFIDPQEFLEKGQTGLYEVDLFLNSERYAVSHRETVIATPDFLPEFRRVGTA